MPLVAVVPGLGPARTGPCLKGRWEPLRWLGVHGLYATYRAADRRERLTSSVEASKLARIADRVAGRH